MSDPYNTRDYEAMEAICGALNDHYAGNQSMADVIERINEIVNSTGRVS